MSQAAGLSEASLLPAGLLRRLGSMVSDGLVTLGVLLLVTLFVFVPVLHVLGKKAMVPSEVGWMLTSIYLACVLSILFVFNGYFWVRSGQTVGMRAWRIKVESEQGRLLTWTEALRRWLLSVSPWFGALVILNIAEKSHWIGLQWVGYGVCGIGCIGLLLSQLRIDRSTWYDRKTGSRIILLPER